MSEVLPLGESTGEEPSAMIRRSRQLPPANGESRLRMATPPGSLRAAGFSDVSERRDAARAVIDGLARASILLSPMGGKHRSLVRFLRAVTGQEWAVRRRLRAADFAITLVVAVCNCIVASAASARLWNDSARAGETLYVLATAPPSVERYDFKQETWLPSIPLPATPTAFTADADGIYLAYDKRIVRRDPDGGNERTLRNTTDTVTELTTAGNFAFLFSFSDAWSVDKVTGEAIDQANFFYSMTGLSAAPGRRILFGRSVGISPSDILAVPFDAAGRFAAQWDSPAHGDFPSASRTWVMPGEARVIDDSGVIYHTNDLSFAANLGGRFDGIDFFGDLPIVLRGATLFGYSQSLLESGRFTLPVAPVEIHVFGATIYTFRPGPGEAIEVGTVAVDLLSPPDPGDPIDPTGLAYEPDEIELGRDGTIYLLQRGLLSVFRWSPSTRGYIDTIPLAEAPSAMAYASDTHRLYFSYPGGRITEIRLTESTAEHTFTNAPQEVCAIAGVGAYLLVCSGLGFSDQSTYGADMELVDRTEGRWSTNAFTWSPANRKAYYFRDGTSPLDLHATTVSPDGFLGPEEETPLHDSGPFVHPIRVSPDGTLVVLGSGAIFDGELLETVDSLPNTIADAAWVYGTLFTVRDIDPDAQVQEWADGFDMRSSFFQLSGRPISLFGIEGLLVAITSVDGVPQFSVYEGLVDTPTPTPTGATSTPTHTPTRTPSATPPRTRTLATTPTRTPPVPACAGDCDGSGLVSIAELVAAVGIALGGEPSACAAADGNSDGAIQINELIGAVRSVLTDCAPLPPTATSTAADSRTATQSPTPSPTGTVSATPTISGTPSQTGTPTATPTLGATCPAGPLSTPEIVPLDLAVRDLVYDPISDRLYASSGMSAGTAAGLLAIDPDSGEVEDSFPIADEPDKLALSRDGRFIYIGLEAAPRVRRFDIVEKRIDLDFALGTDPFYGPLYAEDIAVLPGQSSSVAVSLQRPGVSPRHGGVAVYDNGVKRPLQTPDHTGSNVIEFGDSPYLLYGYNNETTDFGFRRMSIAPDGVTIIDAHSDLFSGFGTDFRVGDGLVVSTGGIAVDLEQAEIVDQFEGVSFGLPLIDPSVRRVFFASNASFGDMLRVEVYDRETFAFVDLFEVPDAIGRAVAFVRYRENGLALAAENKLYLIRSPLVCRPPDA